MRLAHVSDFHFTRLSLRPLKLLSKRLLGYINWYLLRKREFHETQLAPLKELFSKLSVEKVLLSGDFTTTALEEEFIVAKEFLNSLSIPWIATPGNHDKYTLRSAKEHRFYRHFPNEKEGFSFSLKEHGVELHSLKAGWKLIVVDTAIPTHPLSSQGRFCEKTEKHLRELLQELPQTSRLLLLTHYPLFQNDEKRRHLQRAGALEELVKKDGRFFAYLHGHSHRQVLADLRPSKLPLILDSGSASLKHFGGFHLIDLEEKKCTVTPYTCKNGEWRAKKKWEFDVV